jgi:death-on-curing protein
MTGFNIEEILLMHYWIVSSLQEQPPQNPILHPENVEAALARPWQSADLTEAFPDDYPKAAALTESLIKGHPFRDGNKRLGITAGCVFLMINDYSMDASDDDVYEAAMNIGEGKWNRPEIEDWFERRVKGW